MFKPKSNLYETIQYAFNDTFSIDKFAFYGRLFKRKNNEDKLKTLELMTNAEITIKGTTLKTSNKHNRAISIYFDGDTHRLENYKKSPHGASFKERQPLAFKPCKNGFRVYDGIKKYKLSYDEYNEIRKKPQTSKHTLIKLNDYIRTGKTTSLKQCYNNFVEQAEELKKATNGKYNLYKHGRYMNLLEYMVYDFTRMVPDLDNIHEEEAHYIANGTIGAMIYGRTKSEFKHYYYYDVNSYHSSILARNFKYPTSKGAKQTLTSVYYEDTKIIRYGYYRCEFKPITESPAKYLFKTNYNKLYTHIHLQMADELGIKYDLIQDDKPNAYIYQSNILISSDLVFKTMINYLYERKTEATVCKRLLTALWGGMCQSKTRSRKIKEVSMDDETDSDDDEYIVLKKGEQISECSNVKTHTNIIYHEHANMYEYGYARWKPFFLAHVRYEIYKHMKEATDNNFKYIRRVHTDGFLSSKELPKIKLGKELGLFKIERQGLAKIKGCRVEWKN